MLDSINQRIDGVSSSINLRIEERVSGLPSRLESIPKDELPHALFGYSRIKVALFKSTDSSDVTYQKIGNALTRLGFRVWWMGDSSSLDELVSMFAGRPDRDAEIIAILTSGAQMASDAIAREIEISSSKSSGYWMGTAGEGHVFRENDKRIVLYFR